VDPCKYLSYYLDVCNHTNFNLNVKERFSQFWELDVPSNNEEFFNGTLLASLAEISGRNVDCK